MHSTTSVQSRKVSGALPSPFQLCLYSFSSCCQQRHGYTLPRLLERPPLAQTHQPRMKLISGPTYWLWDRDPRPEGSLTAQRTKIIRIDVVPNASDSGNAKATYLAERRDYKANVRGFSRDLSALFDEVCVDDRVEEMVVYGVVHVWILVIITPALNVNVLQYRVRMKANWPPCAVGKEVDIVRTLSSFEICLRHVATWESRRNASSRGGWLRW